MTRYWTDDDSRALDALADEEEKRRRAGIPPDCPDCFGSAAVCAVAMGAVELSALILVMP